MTASCTHLFEELFQIQLLGELSPPLELQTLLHKP